MAQTLKALPNETPTVQFNILELYSGIGGFHYALRKLFKVMNVNYYQITAVDINTTANAIYRHNHVNNDSNGNLQKHILLERNIQSFSAKDLDRLKLDLITMSPPCQPFSRLGLQQDLNDKRSDSFRHLMATLPSMVNKPEYIMMENVKGFETSESHQLFVTTLTECGYQVEEFLLSPIQFSIPNSRLRYYLLARRSPKKIKVDYIEDNIHDKVPVISSDVSIFDNEIGSVDYVESIALTDELNVLKGDHRKTIEHYLNDNIIDISKFMLPKETLIRYCSIFDLVERNSATSNCFTKAYTRRIEGCGSILKTALDEIQICEVYKEVYSMRDQSNYDPNQTAPLLLTLGLRFFTPREVANLMCFPSDFEFPSDINSKQQYRVLGNSVNVLVCCYLLRILLGLRKPIK